MRTGNGSMNVAVIGAGPAGCAAAVQCVRLGLTVVLVDSRGRAGGLVREARLVENCPALSMPVSGMEFAERLKTAVARYSLPIERETVRTVERDRDGFSLHAAGRVFHASAVIVATGTVPVEFSLQGDEAVLFRSFLDLPADLAGSELAVIGGGEAAFDYALHADDLGAVVRVFIRGDSSRAAGHLRGEVESRRDIELMYTTRPESILSDGDSTVLRVLSDGVKTDYRVDAVLAAVGRRATLPDLPGSAAGLFVCGDARLGSLGQAGIAIGQGLAAAGCCREFLNGGNGDQ